MYQTTKRIDEQAGQDATNCRFAYFTSESVLLYAARAHDFEKVFESLDSDNAEEIRTRHGKVRAKVVVELMTRSL